MLVAVVGASGDLGGRIVRRLRTAGAAVRAVARHRERLVPLEKAGASVVLADLRSPETLGQTGCGG